MEKAAQDEVCDFCSIEKAGYGFDWDWDAFLCWICHLWQNTQMFMIRYRVSSQLPKEFQL